MCVQCALFAVCKSNQCQNAFCCVAMRLNLLQYFSKLHCDSINCNGLDIYMHTAVTAVQHSTFLTQITYVHTHMHMMCARSICSLYPLAKCLKNEQSEIVEVCQSENVNKIWHTKWGRSEELRKKHNKISMNQAKNIFESVRVEMEMLCCVSEMILWCFIAVKCWESLVIQRTSK